MQSIVQAARQAMKMPVATDVILPALLFPIGSALLVIDQMYVESQSQNRNHSKERKRARTYMPIRGLLPYGFCGFVIGYVAYSILKLNSLKQRVIFTFVTTLLSCISAFNVKMRSNDFAARNIYTLFDMGFHMYASEVLVGRKGPLPLRILKATFAFTAALVHRMLSDGAHYGFIPGVKKLNVPVEPKKEPPMMTQTLSEYASSQGQHIASHVLDQVSKILKFFTPDIQVDLKKHGVKQSPGIILYGPPGMGKSELAKLIAGYLGLEKSKTYELRASDVIDPLVGQSPRNLSDYFDAVMRKPGIKVVIIDEIDELLTPRGEYVGSGSVTREVKGSVVNEFLQVMENLPRDCLVIGTTNAVRLDPAATRKGRFGVHIFIGVPTFEQKQAILTSHMTSIIEDEEYGFSEIPRSIINCIRANDRLSCADVVSLASDLKLALIVAKREQGEDLDVESWIQANRRYITTV